MSLYGKYLTYAVLALGVNLLWGYTGLLSLGQCLFFALGGYALGMYLMLKIGKLGQYHADIPDFMVFLEFPAKYSGNRRPAAPLDSVPFISGSRRRRGDLSPAIVLRDLRFSRVSFADQGRLLSRSSARR